MRRRFLRRASTIGILALCLPMSGCYMAHAYKLAQGNAAYTSVKKVKSEAPPQHMSIVRMDCMDVPVARTTSSSRTEDRGIFGIWRVTTYGETHTMRTVYCDPPPDFEVVGYFHSPFDMGDVTRNLVELAQHRGCHALALRYRGAIDAGQGKEYISGVCGYLPGQSSPPAQARYRLPLRAQKLGFFLGGTGHLYAGDYVKGGLYTAVIWGSILVVTSETKKEEPNNAVGLPALGLALGTYWYSYKDSRAAAERANARNGFSNDLMSRPSAGGSVSLRLQPYLISDREGKPRLGFGFQFAH